MKFSLSTLLLLWLVIAGAAAADEIPLRASESVTLRFDSVRLLEKGTPPAPASGVGAEATLTLDDTGTVLTIRLQNNSPAIANAALYAFDLGLPRELLNQASFEGTFSGLQREDVWLGPTDSAEPTAGLGASTFAVREAVLGRMEDLLEATNHLPPGALQAGESASIILKIILQTAGRSAGKDATLRLDPRAYFLAPDPKSPQARRVRLVVSSSAVAAK